MRKSVYLAGIVLVAIAFAAGFFTGRNTKDTLAGVTFYAEVEKISDDNMEVRGLEVNDVNSRGRFYFTVEDTTVLEWHHTKIVLDDFEVGDTVAVTYSGFVDETYPARIHNVMKIQLLDDEL